MRFVRRQFPDAAAKTATIRHLCGGLHRRHPTLDERVAALGLDDVELSDRDDVLDPAGARGGRLCRVRRRAVGAVPDARHAALTSRAAATPGRAAQSAWTERSPAQARSAMRRASFCASSSTSASESGRCAMKRRLTPSAMPTMP